MLRRNVIAGLFLTVACGGSAGTDVQSSGPTSFRGISATFSLWDGALYSLPADPVHDGLPITILRLNITDVPLGCAAQDSGGTSPRYSSLNVTIQRARGQISTGRYEVDVSRGVWAGLELLENGCAGSFGIGVSGAVDFSRLDSNAEGVLDVTLNDGTRVTGEFVASPCAPPEGISPLPDGGYPQPFCVSLANEPQR